MSLSLQVAVELWFAPLHIITLVDSCEIDWYLYDESQYSQNRHKIVCDSLQLDNRQESYLRIGQQRKILRQSTVSITKNWSWM